MPVRELNEYRRYMGPSYARVPRGAFVRVYAVYRRKKGEFSPMAFFEYKGEKMCCPTRCLWKLEKGTPGRKPELKKLLKQVKCDCGGELTYLYTTNPPDRFCCRCVKCGALHHVKIEELDFTDVDITKLGKELRLHALKFLQLMAFAGVKR